MAWITTIPPPEIALFSKEYAMSRFCAVVLLIPFIIVAGCRSKSESEDKPPAMAVNPASKADLPPLPRPQGFNEATVQEPPEGEFCPPEITATGKSVGKIYEAVAGKNGQGGLWDQVSFQSAEGKRLRYTATLQTDLGKIVLELRPDLAPNHVRNFVALAKAGYYDGLSFDRTIPQKIELEASGDSSEQAAKTASFDYVEAGCPLGTGEPGYGSVGYWLKPEVSDKATHEEGTVGACHGEELESGAAKFYITLTKAPWMDGNWTVFAKVTQGMDVLRSIFQRPTHDDFRPQEPVVIRQVIIQTMSD